MSTQETKKARRRKNKVATGKYSSVAIPQSNEVTDIVNEESGDAERIARIMDAPDEADVPSFNRGPNPFLDKEKCLLCGVDRSETDPACCESSAADDSEKQDMEGQQFEQKNVAEIPMSAIGLNAVQDIALDSASLGMLGDFNAFPGTGEPLLANGTMCNCDSCLEQRQKNITHEQETKALQTVWTNVRTTVRRLYSMEITNLTDEEATTFHDLVDKLCSRDPHQLYQRLESQVREFVIEKKVNLRRKINAGYNSPPQAREIMSMLLEEYNSLSGVARTVSENLSTLKDHLRRFNVTWELHNKHLYHSIVYAEPAIQGCLDTLCDQLRNGALDKVSFTEDTYPNLMKNFVSFRNEMSVILVLWHDCQQLIDRYSEQQTALKVKQKWLKEDWEFFKTQRKILEQQVLKNNPKASMPDSMEAQFTETMKNMLTGQKPASEESHCPRCSRKRCPCDECTITHMITCGIINPDQLEANGTHHTFNFPHDSSRYIIDVTPPSMSSTTSSSASSSPVPITREMATHQLSCKQPSLSVDQSTEGNSRMDEGDDKEDEADNEEDDDDEENEEDDDAEVEETDEEEGDADEEEEEEEEEEEDEEDDDDSISQDQKEFDAMLASGKLGMPATPVMMPTAESLKLWGAMCQQHAHQPEEPLELSNQDYPAMSPPCACHHCVSPAQSEPRVEVGTEETQCQCHICLQQRGQTVSTALPTSLPPPPRAAQLHLYPHIHGTLPPTAHPHLHISNNHASHPMISHMPHTLERNLLQPQLYNLHGPSRVPFKLDFEDPDAFSDHLLNAYGDWDNSSYDSTRLLGPPPHRFSTPLSPELLPSPPLTADASFSLEAVSPSVASASHTVAVSHSLLGSGTVTSTSNSFKAVATAGFATGIPPAFQIPVDPFIQDPSPTPTSISQPQHVSSIPELNLNLRSTPLSSLPINFSTGSPSSLSSLPVSHNPPCTRPVTLGGNVGNSPVPGKEQRTYAQPCKKYSLSSQNSGVGASGKVGPAPPPPSSHNHMNVGMPSGAPAASSKTPKSRQPVPSSQPSHACTHGQHGVHNSGGEGQADIHAGLGSCASGAALPTTINNVSVGTSTLCTDPDCQSHHDDNCDSIDDSCSEKSSSTTASNNQKEGKYCDCCYCEFFGHGNPPVAQTSKNYTEMRERLRRRLKQRNEAKQDGSNNEGESGISRNTTDLANLDELLKYINGTDSEGAKGDSQSSRAAKRARQKQRKAEERLRQEEEEEERRKKEAEKINNSTNSGGQKKKSKHKEDKMQKTITQEETVGDNKSKPNSNAKQRLKECHSENNADKIGVSLQTSASYKNSASCGKTAQIEQQMAKAAASLISVSKESLSKPPTNNREMKKSAEVFQPPPHLMRNLAEHAMQESKKISTTPSTVNPSPLPTLGGQPNSPTAKKAKRRLAPAGTQSPMSGPQNMIMSHSAQVLRNSELQRRMDAKNDVAKQIKEAQEFSQTKMRFQQLHQSQMLQQQKEQQDLKQEKIQQEHQLQMKLSKQFQQQLKTQQQMLQQAHQQQAKMQQQKQQQLQQASIPRQPSPGQQNSMTTQMLKQAAGCIAAQYLSGNTNHGKMANGVGLASRPHPFDASDVSMGKGTAHNKQLSSTKGMNQSPKALLPENHSQIANMAQKNNTEHQEQEQSRNARGKTKKKKKAHQDIRAVDEVFMPRPEEELESNDMDEADRDIEKFKRFVMENPTPPKERQKLDINLNMKDIFSKKKSGLGCT